MKIIALILAACIIGCYGSCPDCKCVTEDMDAIFKFWKAAKQSSNRDILDECEQKIKDACYNTWAKFICVEEYLKNHKDCVVDLEEKHDEMTTWVEMVKGHYWLNSKLFSDECAQALKEKCSDSSNIDDCVGAYAKDHEEECVTERK